MKLLIIIASLLVSATAFAQRQQPSQEQLYRQVISFMSQDNARLGAEKDQLQMQIQTFTAQLVAARKQSEQEQKK